MTDYETIAAERHAIQVRRVEAARAVLRKLWKNNRERCPDAMFKGKVDNDPGDACDWCREAVDGNAHQGVEVHDRAGLYVGLVHYDGCLEAAGLRAAFDAGNDGAAVSSWVVFRA